MRTLLFLAFAAFLSACSKDIRSTNKIHGTWNINDISGTHHTSPVSGTMQFDKCNIPEKHFRTFREDYSYQSGDSIITVKQAGAYKFESSGKVLLVKIAAENGTKDTRFTILEHTKKSLSMERTDPLSGQKIVYTLTRKD